jgi:hypothetical protein
MQTEEQKRAYSAKYYKEHKEQEIKRCRERRKRYPDEGAKRSKKWKMEHPERAKEYEKERWNKNKDMLIKKNKEWAIKNPEKRKASSRKSNLRKYGITPEEYDRIFKDQDGKCAICHRSPTGVGRNGKVLHVDHNHKTGKVRGLLCPDCNLSIGRLGDSIDVLKSAIAYLEYNDVV